MSEGNQTETTASGRRRAVAPWSARIRLGTLVLILGIVTAATVLILQNSRGNTRAIVTSHTSVSRSTSTDKTIGLSGSGIGPVDPAKRPSRAASATVAPITSQSTLTSAQPTPSAGQTTRPAAPSTSPSAPSKSPSATSTTPTSRPPTPTPTPTPKPTPTKHCLGKICF